MRSGLRPRNCRTKPQLWSVITTPIRYYPLTRFQVSVQRERDALLAEKATWTKSTAPSTTEGTSGESWVEEKTQVLRERDEALVNWKVSRLRCDHAQLSICPTESTGAGEPTEKPVEAELHADREQRPPYQFVAVH